jgi:hypothetical protein
VEIDELRDASIYDLIPEFVKLPLPAITLLGGSATFCTRVTPIDSNVVWSVCGREISEDMKDCEVSESFVFIYMPYTKEHQKPIDKIAREFN